MSTLDKLFLELSELTTVKTKRELRLEERVTRLLRLIQGVIQRCEPLGLVGEDRHYLKDLCDEFKI